MTQKTIILTVFIFVVIVVGMLLYAKIRANELQSSAGLIDITQFILT